MTALVRSEKDTEVVRATGVADVVHGSHDDLEKIQKLAAQADIVVNAADADDLPLTKAILQGLKTRSMTVAYSPILIHTSGTGVISDQAEGEFAPSGQKIWNVRSVVFTIVVFMNPMDRFKDNSEDDIRSIPPEQPHRLIDLEYVDPRS